MDSGEIKIDDPLELQRVRNQASRVRFKALLSAILLTLLALIPPPMG